MAKLFRHIARLFCTALLIVTAGSAGAQSAGSYPNKPIRVIIPFAAGGSTDVVLRIFTDRMSKDLGQSFVLDNRGGAEGIAGTTVVAKGAPDGYTLLATTPTILINHWLHSDRPYETLKDLTPIALLSRQDFVLAIHPSVQAKDWKEFVSYAKANPGKLNAGSSSSTSILNYQRIMSATDVKFTVVNYRSSGLLLPDLLNGTIHIYMSGIGTIQSLITVGKLRGLATTGDKRSAMLPNVPTFAEAGLKNFDATNWIALFAPSKTPKDIIAKLNAEVRRIQQTPDAINVLEQRTVEPYPTTVAQADQFMRTELEKMGKLIKDSGLKAGAD